MRCLSEAQTWRLWKNSSRLCVVWHRWRISGTSAPQPCARRASSACRVTDRWFSHHFSIVPEFRLAEVSSPAATEPVWPACWVDTVDRSASSASEVVQDIWDIFWREELGTVLPDLTLALWSAFDRNCVDEFCNVWSAVIEAGLLRSYQRAGGPVSSSLQAFIERGTLQIQRRRLGSRAAGSSGPVSCIILARAMKLVCRRRNFLSTPPLVLCCFFGVG